MYLTQQQANDKDLITQLAGQIIKKPAYSVQALGGCTSYNYEINHSWIFKLPSFRSNSDLWIAQSQYMPKLQEQLKYQIPVPKIQRFGLPQGRVVGCCYPKIQGKTFQKSIFTQKPLAKKVAFFEELSNAMEQLHGVSVEKLDHSFNDTVEQLGIFLFKKTPDKAKIFATRIKKEFQKCGISLKNNLLCHTDLHSHNIVSDAKGHIVGILDFDNLSMGDSFMEFRPGLFEKKDLNLLRHIYQEQTTHPINHSATKCMENLYEQMFFLYSLGAFGHDANTLIKPQTKLVSKKEITRAFKTNPNRWANFGRN